ncbi:MAG: peptide-methionine (S)-S-oxide reductase MsrA [Thermodesulfobacteriota bacterium]
MKTIIMLYTIMLAAVLLLHFADQPAQAAGQGGAKARATFAGGCFWCLEKPFEHLDGVEAVISGYIAGASKDPTYENYAAGGHIEAVEIIYDPARISYTRLLDVFWHQIDPTDPDGQFVDRGHAYTSAIFYHDQQQKEEAEKSKEALGASNIFSRPIVTPILAASTFYPAEEYHQDYYRKNPLRYQYYRYGSGRDRFLDKVWGKERPK